MLPRLLMPYSFAWPPVECCRGTRPSQAANSRPLLNAAPLPIALSSGLDGNKAHILPGHGFGNGFGIEEVVLIGLEKWFYKLRWNQPHFMTLVAKRGPDKVRTRTGFEANQ